MEIHGNARLLPRQRALLCRRVRLEGWSVAEAAQAFAVSTRSVLRRLAGWDAGEPMTDRSSALRRRPTRTPAELESLIERLRRLRWTGPRIAAEPGVPTSTVCAVRKRLGLNRLWRLEPPEPPNRYCRRHAGELIHVDVKKLGRFNEPGPRVRRRGKGAHRNRGVGWEYCHVAIDDCTRLAYVGVHPDEKGPTCVAFLRRAVAWFASKGVAVQEVLTDNGTGTGPSLTAPPPPSSASGIAALGPTGPARTARRSASSRPCSASGPTRRPIRATGTADEHFCRGSRTTTVDDHTAP